jgi:hypothetical protein
VKPVDRFILLVCLAGSASIMIAALLYLAGCT